MLQESCNAICYQAWVQLRLLMNQEDFIQETANSIGAPKMYGLENGILGTQISTLGFFDNTTLDYIFVNTRRNFFIICNFHNGT